MTHALVLVMRDYPMGFCPVDFGEGIACGPHCKVARTQFIEAADGIARYFGRPRDSRVSTLCLKYAHQRCGGTCGSRNRRLRIACECPCHQEAA